MNQKHFIDAALAGRLQRMAERVAELEMALRFYANETTWTIQHDTAPAYWDCGAKARAALGEKS